MNRIGVALVVLILVGAAAAPVIAPHTTAERFPDLLNVPPTVPHLFDGNGTAHAPFIYPWKIVSRLEQRYEQDTSTRVALHWFTGGRLVSSGDEVRMPLLMMGSDSYGRDVFSRLLFGGRVSLALSIVSALGAVLAGGLIGAMSGYFGGATDEMLMRTTDVIMVLPAMYVALALRAVLPLVLEPSTVFVFLALIFAILGMPFVSRGVRGLVRTERRLEYAVAAVSLGAGHWRMLVRHLLPAARGFLIVQITMLVPAFIVAEATLSYVGIGFGEPVASWGTMLQEASNVRTFTDFPWLLSPAVAIFLVVLALNLLLEGKSKRVEYTTPM